MKQSVIFSAFLCAGLSLGLTSVSLAAGSAEPPAARGPVKPEVKKQVKPPAKKVAGKFVGKAGTFSMMDSVEAAFAFNPELKASQEGQVGAQFAVDRAKAGFFPRVTAQAGFGSGWRDDGVSRSYDEQRDFRGFGEASMRLIQPLWHGGAIMAEYDMRKAMLSSSGNMLEDRGLSLAFQAIAAHTDVLRRREMVRLAKNNVKEHEGILRTVRERYETNISTAGELHQITGRVARAKATLSAYQSALDAAMANYLRVTGKNAPELAMPPRPSLPYKDLEGALEACRAGNPRIKAALDDVSATKHERNIADSRFLPSLDVEVGPYWTDRDRHGPDRTGAVEGMVKIRWDLFDSGADLAAVSMADSKTRQTRHNASALVNMLDEDVESTYSRYMASAEQIKEYAAAKKASRLAREDYYLQFLAAQRSLIDVLDSENDYFYAASQMVMSEGDQVIAAYRLLALGGDLLRRLDINAADLRLNVPMSTPFFNEQ